MNSPLSRGNPATRGQIGGCQRPADSFLPDKLTDLVFDELALFPGFDSDHLELGFSRVGPRLLIRRGGLR
jgi:hypothetical protein